MQDTAMSAELRQKIKYMAIPHILISWNIASALFTGKKPFAAKAEGNSIERREGQQRVFSLNYSRSVFVRRKHDPSARLGDLR